MAVEITIPDGDPWWLSPNVWTVPGNDPNGPPGSPIAEAPCYLWARVSNAGTSAVSDATVRFYWADPSVGFDRTTAHPVGTSFVSLSSAESADVLCLTPWIPTFVNDGHECILAEAFRETSDPLAATTDFNVSTDRHVAQRNLSVLEAAASGFFFLSFVIANPSRKAHRFLVQLREGELEQLHQLHKSLPRLLGADQKHQSRLEAVGLVHRQTSCPGDRDLAEAREGIEIKIPARSRHPVTLLGRLRNADGKGGVLLHVEQRIGNVVCGGLSAYVRPPDAGQETGTGKTKKGKA